VSVFSLREALSVLRDEGLIVTRPGKNGGSFARTPPDPTPVARNMLVQLSTSELIDLGDWRQMLTGHGAALAASRASASNVERLETFADQVSFATTLRESRHAYGRFHLELAAAAQSARLARAELTMSEEFSLLMTLLLADGESRSKCAESLRTIVDAIRSRKPSAAQERARTAQAAIVEDLARLRLRLLATESRTRYPGRSHGRPDIENAVDHFAEQAVHQLGRMAQAVRPRLAGETPANEISSVVARTVHASLGSIEPVIHGVGVIAEVGVVREHPYWIEWWHRDTQGTFERDSSHVLDASHEDFYDYANYEYMTGPRMTHSPWAMGPYVDYGGTDDYVITISVPILDGDRFLGIAAADFRVAELEAYFAPWLAAQESESAVLNDESRVIVSNSSLNVVGSIAQARSDQRTTELGYFGWSLATSGS
jgi:DNA-binding FadR family transcriptional regulator